MGKKKMTYKDAGVDYGAMDPYKLMAQLAGRETAINIIGTGYHEIEASRGESCYLIEFPHFYLGFLVEGLGTKNKVAEAMYQLTGKSYFENIAQDTVAMIVNDMITSGARPLAVAQYLGAGHSDWFKDKKRYSDLIEGWKYACTLARCTMGPGETPTLVDIIYPDTVDLSGAAVGIIEPKSRLITGDKIQDGDAIIFFTSSGIHANGLTLARRIAEKVELPEGYLTEILPGKTFGELLLEPTYIYVGIIEDLLNYGVDIHYAVNITGHGWRKLMRAAQPFTYVVKRLPRQLPIFDFMQKYGPMDDREAYGNLNMGAGFAIYVPYNDLNKSKIWSAFEHRSYYPNNDFDMVIAGHIEKSKHKKVVIEPKGIVFEGSTLGVR